ncbi:endo alpha-1,4 polygalactosaminidase [Candidatus Pacearchaeota archaeon]|nr:endo alpha-1,4 polygalactosaminidase [Candidatus Pacearchaeota archaeon]
MKIKRELLVLIFVGILLLGGYTVKEIIWSEEPVPAETIENITAEQNVSRIDVVKTNESKSVNIFWWKPKPNTSWQWQLNGIVNQNYDVDMYDVDLFDNSKEVINALKNKGIKVICYFSAGSYENWRIDEGDFPNEVKGKVLEGWEDEKWLDISKIELLAPIMKNRLDLAVEKGCDGVEPDNVDGYLNDNGFDLSYQNQLDYNKWLAEEAHKRGLTVGLKNDVDQIPELVNYFDFALNEQCFEYDECETLLPFIEQDKAVFGVEYELQPTEFCNKAIELNFDWLKMEYDLDGDRISCR